MQLSLELFVEFLSAKGVPNVCEICHKDHGWAVNGADNEGSNAKVELVLPYMTRGYEDRYNDVLLYGRAVITAECGNCGNLRSFSRDAVEQWARVRVPSEDRVEVPSGK